MSRDSETVLAPGFRFHPTDEELVGYYLKRKVLGRPFRFDAISDVDVYKSEPWDLPDKSKLKSRDLQWYFFSLLDRKYGNGSRTNRATERGYWKTTGKDRSVYRGSRAVGMKKTLVYHLGRAPRGERSNWVMHEYKLVDEEIENVVAIKEPFVLCRIFQKSGSGPKNGEQYGAPFVEEDWDDEVVALVPGRVAVNELPPVDDVSIEENEHKQELETADPPKIVPLLLDINNDEIAFNVEDCWEDMLQNNEDFGLHGNYLKPDLPDNDKYENEETDGMFPKDVNYLLDEPYLDANRNFQDMDAKSYEDLNPVDDASALFLDDLFVDASENGLFLETNDLSNTLEVNNLDGSLLGEFFTSLDAEDVNSHDLFLETKNPITVQESMKIEELMNVQSEENTLLKAKYASVASTSNYHGGAVFDSAGNNDGFLKRASCSSLERMAAPPAFACENPSKDMITHLNSATHSSSPSIHATACLIQTPDINKLGMKYSFDKNGNLNLILSFDLNLLPALLSSKLASPIPWNLVCTVISLGILFSASFKLGTCIHPC